MSKHCLSDSKWSNNHTLWSVLSFVASPSDCWWAKDKRRAEISFCRKRTQRCDLKIKKHEILVHQLKSFTDTWASASFFSTSCMSSFKALISASLSLENGCMASSWAFISSWQCDKVACEHQVYRIYRKTKQPRENVGASTLIKASFSLRRLCRCSVSPPVSLCLSHLSSCSSCSLSDSCLRSSCSWPVRSLITKESL